MIKFNNYQLKYGEFIPIFSKDRTSKDQLFGPIKIGKLLFTDRIIVLFNLNRDFIDSTRPIGYREQVKKGDYYNYIWFTSLEDYDHFVNTFNPIIVDVRDAHYSDRVMGSISKDCFRILYKR